MAGEKPLLLLVDGHSLAFRSFYAFARGAEGGLRTRNGIPTSVTYGFLRALLDNCRGLTPGGVVVAFDTAEPTFRHEADAAYKAHREEAPQEFFEDLANLQRILSEGLDLSICSASGYEADDVLGTLANRAADSGWRVRILSGDRDLFQLVDDERDIAVLYMGGGPSGRQTGPLEIRHGDVELKLGVPPEEVVDLKALTGDSSDNIPGVRGVGPKTAIALLRAHGCLDGIYAALDRQKAALRRKLENDRENAFRSRMLARIQVDVPLEEPPRLELGRVNSAILEDQLKELELFSLARQVDGFRETFSTGHPSADDGAAGTGPAPEDDGEGATPPGPPDLRPRIITTADALEALCRRLMQRNAADGPVALDTETTDLNPFRAELVGIGLCWGEGAEDLAYIPIAHAPPDGEAPAPPQLPLEQVLTALAPWLASGAHPKALQNAKYDRLILLRHGLDLDGVVMDTLLADYLRDAGERHGLEAMAERNFGFTPTAYSDLVPRGASFAAVPVEAAALYCGMDVHLTRRLAFLLRDRLAAMGPALIRLLDEVELPLEPVLAAMEATGIRIDVPYLETLSAELAGELERLEAEARQAAGVDFNLASPKQLGALLFETLGLDRRKSRRTKTGWSTDATVLERLSEDHPVVPLVLEHRTLSKLRSTYVDALPALVEPETGRVHTDFNQAVTATGRLSSSNPNLQNIPVRTDFSRRIRQAFLPQEGWRLISADYSQIELRILTHLSGEEPLIEAFREGEDVHALTARLLFEVENVTPEQRRLGKTINFGVIYGMGVQRFARETNESQDRARSFLLRFRERYPKLFAFLERQERLALSRGYVETILGRRRTFHFDPAGLGRLLGSDPDGIDLEQARRRGLEGQQLRAAANAPIQGSSADIIKLAMVRLHRRLQEEQLHARLLLQVHDELVLEAAPQALERCTALTREVMEGAVRLSVPLVVETRVGENWMEAK